jgi:hypothetical protein
MSKTFARTAALFSAATTLAITSSAFALTTPAGMGTEGSLTISADRLFGVLISSTYSETSQGNATVENTSRSTDINIINPAASGAGPRVGIDYTVIPKLTIGVAVGIGFGSSSNKTKVGGQETSTDGPSSTTILFAPRVGYMIDFSDQLGLWPRAGITLVRKSDKTTGGQGGDTTTTFQQIGATVDVPLVIAPADHFAFTVGPFVDFPLTSSYKTEAGGQTVEPDKAPKITNFGLAVGMLGSF